MKQLSDTQFFSALYLNFSIRKNEGAQVINRNAKEASLVCEDKAERYSSRCRYSKQVQNITLNIKRGQKVYEIGSDIVIYGGTINRNTPKQCMMVAQDGRTNVTIVEGWIFKGAVARGSKKVAVMNISRTRSRKAQRLVAERKKFAQYELPQTINSNYHRDHSKMYNHLDNIFVKRGGADSWYDVEIVKSECYGKCAIVTIKDSDTLKYIDGHILVIHEGASLLRKEGSRVAYVPWYRDYHASCFPDAVYYRGRVREIGPRESYAETLEHIQKWISEDLTAFKASRKFGIPFGHEDLGTIGSWDYPNLTAERAHDIALEKWGVDIPVELFQHNIDAWSDDYKSEACNDTFSVFTPCGHNPLQFRVSYNVENRESYVC